MQGEQKPTPQASEHMLAVSSQHYTVQLTLEKVQLLLVLSATFLFHLAQVIIGDKSILMEGCLVETHSVLEPGTVLPPGRLVPAG